MKAQGKRPDQLAYSVTVLLWLTVVGWCGVLAGAAVALWQAILTH